MFIGQSLQVLPNAGVHEDGAKKVTLVTEEVDDEELGVQATIHL
jgi:hypothetical protein